MTTTYLSKSLYNKGLQCHKALWLHKNRPELKDKVSAAQQAAFAGGTDVGILAQELFPGGVLVPYDGLSHDEQLAMTAAALSRGETTIYEATFSFDNVFVKVDILHQGAGGWEIHEVKSSTECKEVYLNDIAVQYYVLAGAGLPISQSCIVHINKKYVRHGAIEVDKLFTIQDVTEKTHARQASLSAKLAAMREALGEDLLAIDVGPHCEKPYKCDFKGHCWSHIPKDSVFSLRGKGRSDPFKLYRDGIVQLKDVPLNKLGRRQLQQVEGFLHQKSVIDTDAVRKFLDSLWYPLYFLDFETTYLTPVPLFDGTKPYQKVPFQYSLHILDHEGAELQHHAFLAESKADPQAALIVSLLAAIPDNACVLAYNKGFEVDRLKELAERFPEHGERIAGIIGNVRDLMKPFERRHIYFPAMKGSYSIKAVLPALLPEMSYTGLDVNNGAMAAESYLRMLHLDDVAAVEKIRRDLLAYCCLDTLAMVRILERMREMV